MKKIIKLLTITFLLLSFAACSRTDPEAKALMDEIKSVMNNDNANVNEYLRLKQEYDVLTDEVKDQVSNYEEFEKAVINVSDNRKNELSSALRDFQIYTSAKEKNVTVIELNGSSATIKEYTFDGNREHENANIKCDYLIDNDTILVLKDEMNYITLEYTVNGNTIDIQTSGYYTAKDIDDAIQGSWTCRTQIFGKSNEHNINVKSPNATFEYAAESAWDNDGSYYYYGPYSGKYTIHDCLVEIDCMHGGDYFFDCYNNKISFYHFDTKLSKGNGLKGEKGYKF